MRSVGVRAAGLAPADTPLQLSLINDEAKRLELENIDIAVDKLRRRYGYMSVQRGITYTDKQLGKINPKDDHTVHPTGFFY